MEKIIAPNPPHVLMPSKLELEDAGAASMVGRWKPEDCFVCSGRRSYVGYQTGSATLFDTYECDCEEQLLLWRWFAIRGLTQSAMQLRFADMDGEKQKEWNAFVLDYAHTNHESSMRVGQSYIFHGASGSGKSSYAWLAMKLLLFNGHQCHAFSAASLDQYAFLWKTDQERMDRWYRRVLNCDLLVVDDLGKGSAVSTKMVDEVASRVITARAENRLATIITTNLDAEGLRIRFGDSIEMLNGSGVFVSMSLPDSWRDVSLRRRDEFEKVNNIARPAVWG